MNKLNLAKKYFAKKLGLKTIKVHLDLLPDTDCGYFTIENNKPIIVLNVKKDCIATLAHEVIHYWQYCRGFLKFKKNKVYWEGEDMTDKNYWYCPFEIEARMRGQELLRDFNLSLLK